MIPVNPLGILIGTLLLLLSIKCLCALFVGVAALCTQRGRAYLLTRPRRFAVLALLLVLGSLPMLNLLGSWVGHWQEDQALSPRLEQDEVLGDLHLPAGTRVWLERLEPLTDLSGNPLPYGLQSLKRARFDSRPGRVLGFPVRELKLDGGRGLADLTLALPVEVQGWRCSPDAEARFNFPFNAPFVFADWRLRSCMLVADSKPGDVAWPGRVTVTDFGRGVWGVQSDADETPQRLGRLTVNGLHLSLQGEPREVAYWSARLAEALQLEGMAYPAGTLVKGEQGRLIFAANDQAPARDLRTGKDIPVRHAVAHDESSGKLLGVYPIEQVGVYPLQVSDDYE